MVELGKINNYMYFLGILYVDCFYKYFFIQNFTPQGCLNFYDCFQLLKNKIEVYTVGNQIAVYCEKNESFTSLLEMLISFKNLF